MRKLLFPVAVSLLISCLAGIAEAAENKKNSGMLVLVHRKGFIQNQTYRADWDRINLEPEMGLELRSTEEVTVVVKDPNPLLFTYSWNGIKEADTLDYQNATKFASALDSLTSILGKIQGAESAAAGNRAMSFQNRRESAGDQLFNKRWSLLSDEEKDEATILAEIKAVLDSLPEGFFGKLSTDIGALSTNITSLPVLIERSAGDESAVARVKFSVEQWGLDSLSKRLEGNFKKIDDVEIKILDITSRLDARRRDIEDLDSLDPRILAILMAKDQQLRIEEMIKTLQSFRKDVTAIDQPLTLGTFGYSPTKVKTASFEIKAVPANAKISDTTKRKTGTFSVVAEPLSPVHFGFGGAAVYSFVEKPEFVAKFVTDHLEVARNEQAEEYIGQKVAAVLTITPRAWTDPVFGGHFEIGFNPEKDRRAFFLGAALRIYNLAHVGAGWTYQEVPTLGGNLEVGDRLNSASDLKLDTDFTSGVYISISVTTK